MFENILINILLCGLLLFYPFIHNLFRYIGEKFIKNEKFFLNYIRFINILFLPSCIFIVGLFLFTDFSFNSGWQFVQESSASRQTDWTGGRAPLFAILFIIYPTFIILLPLIYGFTIISRIRNPQKLLNEDYD